MNTTSEILTVDGTVLNTLAKNIESIAGRLHVPGKRTANQVIPGKHGTQHVGGKLFEANVLVLPMWVRGCDDDGAVPTGSTREEFFTNLDELSRLFTREGLRDIRHTLPDGSIRQCFGEVLSAIDFSITGHNPMGKYSVEVEVPEVFWQDLDTRTQNLAVAAGNNYHFTTFDGISAPICDSLITVTGPVGDIGLTDSTSGEWLEYGVGLAAGQQLVIDCANWDITVGGADVIQNLSHSHDYFLPLTPNIAGQVWVTVTGSGFGAGTSVQIAAKRKYLVG